MEVRNVPQAVACYSEAHLLSRCGTMTGSRRHAGTVLGGRRRGKRPRSPEDEGRWTTGDGVAGGHGRPRTDKSTECQRGFATDSRQGTTHACEGRKQDSQDGDKCRIYLWGPSQRYIRPIHSVVYRTREEKKSSFMPSLPCAPSAHSSPLGLAPTTAHKHDPTQAPVSWARAVP